MKDKKKYSSIANSNILADDEIEKALGGVCAEACKAGCTTSCKPGEKTSGSPTTPAT